VGQKVSQVDPWKARAKGAEENEFRSIEVVEV